MAQRTRGIGAHSDFGALTLLLQDSSMSVVVYARSPTDLLYSWWA
jgi:isopenicillin N synthase-like dioxygenase